MEVVAQLGPLKSRIVISRIERKVLAAVVLVKFKFHYLPGIIELIPVFVNIEKTKMVVKPCSVFALVTECISCLLKSVHVERSFGPLAAGDGQFLPEACGQLVDIEDVNPLRFTRQRVRLDCWQSGCLVN